MCLEHRIITEEMGELRILALVVKNGVFLIVSDAEYMIGTTAIALPLGGVQGETASSIYPVFGVRNEILAKSIAERIAKKTNKTAIASVFIRRQDQEHVDNVLALLKKLMERL